MANPVFGFLLFASLFWASKQVPFHIPQVLLGMRIAYALSTVLVLLVYTYTKGSIDNDNSKAVFKETSVLIDVPEPASKTKNGKDEDKDKDKDKDKDAAKKTSISVQEYDHKQWRALIKGFCMSLAMMSAMHLYMGMPGPLLINMVIPLKTALGSELVQARLFGKKVDRPFPEPKSMFAMLASARTQLFGVKDEKEVKQQ
ncbi:Inorganic phosphate transporter Pho88 [Cordyceps fumosorosea ARSEF 2679]|uniref:Inorganic phosphate transporter Pho88 n=1 Tax=Cordyceps fumosorosea (strain ARSEF 2679) TaxID=1081104 RepID=A0A162LUU3_CORFA|nr:Inorganic phosphate transporter Pho88 [Cordyceps fumosorosea ARSEF 2679]OAA45080.1 Inorganic phosphate transporter Pho88 [Cordyceps fumosorosea ARSEF 2679]